jgi:hypothetical protein
MRLKKKSNQPPLTQAHKLVLCLLLVLTPILWFAKGNYLTAVVATIGTAVLFLPEILRK